ncbi:MAG: crossover junction endodeoxyribonuclease RuvC [Bacteroidetes bacterium]|nr:MAG: crossover junction endodeoxyribonuclease RuvC [Bacteroidota bacterium]
MTQRNKPEKIILGVDPGTRYMGWGIIKKTGKKLEVVDMGVLNIKSVINPWKKLETIFNEITTIIMKYLPDEMAIEGPFYGEDAQAMLKLGRAQGAAIIAAIKRSLPVFEYQPLRVKQAVTGNGRSSKEQVAGMVINLLKLQENPTKLDITDALAVAICHANQDGKTALKGKKGAGWAQFLKENPERIRKS